MALARSTLLDEAWTLVPEMRKYENRDTMMAARLQIAAGLSNEKDSTLFESLKAPRGPLPLPATSMAVNLTCVAHYPSRLWMS